MTRLILGVDPGKTGALALLDADYPGRLLVVEDMPAATGAPLGRLVAELLADVRPDEVVAAWVEDVHAMPAQGVRSVWTFAEGHGAVLGALGVLEVPVHLVAPSAWKKAAGLGKDKSASRQRAMELWPARASWFARVRDDGRAEAALIALHGWRQGQGS